MPVATYTEATDLIHAFFKDGWDADADSQDIEVLYDDLNQKPPDDDHWARFIVDYNNNRHVTVGGETGNRRFTRYGLVTVQLFTKAGEGKVNADVLADVVTNIFEGNSTGLDSIWFRDCDRHDIGVSGRWYQTNMVIRFEYDTVK